MDLQSLTRRASQHHRLMRQTTDEPVMLVRIENEHWVFERLEFDSIHRLSHRLIVHEQGQSRTIGGTEDLQTAVEVARCMAQQEQKTVTIHPIKVN